MKTTVNTHYDVAVCGGGFAGISAALAAARQGKKVVLFEKMYMLGGLGTAGLVTIYLPLCDGMGRQVSFGLAEELLRLSIKYGAESRYPENWLDGVGTRTEKDKRFRVGYNAQVFAILAEQALLEAGVDVLYGSYAVDAEVENGRITRVLIENKSGRTAYVTSTVVDATGDCDIARFAGAPTEDFKAKNVLAAWYYFTDETGYQLQMLGAADISEEELQKRAQVGEQISSERFTGLEAEEISRFVQLSHQKTLAHWLEKRKAHPETVISTIATMPQLRMTRKLVGEYTLAYDEEHTYFEDSIGMISNWRRRGPVYEVPFRTLYSRKIKNLITAGRCVSTDQPLWDIMRVIPCCAVTGEAAGVAATMTDDFTTLDVKALQKILQQNGVVLHESDLSQT